MDRKGDHGGDGDLEVVTGLCIYSKRPGSSAKSVPRSHLPLKTFPRTAVSTSFGTSGRPCANALTSWTPYPLQQSRNGYSGVIVVGPHGERLR